MSIFWQRVSTSFSLNLSALFSYAFFCLRMMFVSFLAYMVFSFSSPIKELIICRGPAGISNSSRGLWGSSIHSSMYSKIFMSSSKKGIAEPLAAATWHCFCLISEISSSVSDSSGTSGRFPYLAAFLVFFPWFSVIGSLLDSFIVCTLVLGGAFSSGTEAFDAIVLILGALFLLFFGTRAGA